MNLKIKIVFHVNCYELIHKVQRPHEPFENNFSANIKLLKTQVDEIGQSERYLGILLQPLLKTGLPLMKNVLKSLAKGVLIPLGLIATASATNSAVH